MHGHTSSGQDGRARGGGCAGDGTVAGGYIYVCVRMCVCMCTTTITMPHPNNDPSFYFYDMSPQYTQTGGTELPRIRVCVIGSVEKDHTHASAFAHAKNPESGGCIPAS